MKFIIILDYNKPHRVCFKNYKYGWSDTIAPNPPAWTQKCSTPAAFACSRTPVRHHHDDQHNRRAVTVSSRIVRSLRSVRIRRRQRHDSQHNNEARCRLVLDSSSSIRQSRCSVNRHGPPYGEASASTPLTTGCQHSLSLCARRGRLAAGNSDAATTGPRHAHAFT